MLPQLGFIKARNIWIQAQKLDKAAPFGTGSAAVAKAVSHLGYVQIDTINVIERCHHHILFNRIPSYKRADLHRAQSADKTVFEYWTHALAYVPTADYRFFMPRMLRYKKSPGAWFAAIKKEEMQKVLRRLRKDGALSIRDIKDDLLVEKAHEWGSKKPSKKVLQFGFHNGLFTICERRGMLKQYDLTARHFGWASKPKAASRREYIYYLIERSLRSQGVVSVDSICHLENPAKAEVLAQLEALAKKKELVEVKIEGAEKSHWLTPEVFERKQDESERLHILSPFDPLIIQRKRLKLFFDYEHIFEAYVTPARRKFGYFTLPVLCGNNIIAMLDLKTDRERNQLLIQSWHWRPRMKSAMYRRLIEDELQRFEAFQLVRS